MKIRSIFVALRKATKLLHGSCLVGTMQLHVFIPEGGFGAPTPTANMFLFGSPLAFWILFWILLFANAFTWRGALSHSCTRCLHIATFTRPGFQPVSHNVASVLSTIDGAASRRRYDNVALPQRSAPVRHS